ncbi:hypothetical protein [Paracraurococcus ruber]|uniref:Uncharacterized protein n=2 Tax=Paracraurococcus ruber TaxID=77675 RepID=A0ABS1D826_9PROT|nr:hypothetical protein [Paracraurococcus ruber]MBK1662029.1 hypothetical protein [Paracraurococcus ruber]TDG27131.1 hypothetical protein E2C05_24035 [Paracraurococcus ruber]
MHTVPGIRPLVLPRLPADFFLAPRDPAAPEPLRLEWPKRGPGFKLAGDPAKHAAFRAAVAEYEAAELAAAHGRLCGDIRGFFAAQTEIHRCYAALEAFDLPAADLARLQSHARRRAKDAAQRERREGEAA